MEINQRDPGTGKSPNAHDYDHDFRSPRAAAIAGILFAALFTTSYGLFVHSAPDFSADTSVYMIRMAGMFMIVLGTIWKRTGLMPRWLIISTYVLALILLLSSDFSPWLMLIFPFWVLLVSVYILYLNYRQPDNTEGLSDGMTPEDPCE